MFRPFAEWLATTPVSQLLQNQLWIVPTSQSIHIVCVGIVFASALAINLRLLGAWGAGRPVSQLAATLVPWMKGALLVLLVTGTVQTVAEPVREFIAPLFWAKLVMIVVVVLMTAEFIRQLRRHAPRWDAAVAQPADARVFAVSSSILWVLIIVCGRFIGYTSALYA